MDEPTSSLDPKSSKAIEELVFNLKQKRTIILVTHNMEQAKRISDEVVFICDSQFCEAGPADELFANPRCQETQEYLQQGD